MPTHKQWAFFRLKDGASLSRQRHLLIDAELVVLENVLGTQGLIASIRQAFGCIFQSVGSATASPAIEITHVGAQAGFFFN
jgi:hypothetical protein